MKNISILILFIFCVAVSAKDWGRELSEVLDREPNVKVNLGGGMLGLAKAFTKDDSEAQAVLSGLEGMSIHVYEFESNDEDENLSAWIGDAVKVLSKQGLQEIIKVADGDERVHIFADVSKDKVSDLTLMVYEPGDEFVFITMEGLIDFNRIKEISANFNVDLDGLDISL